MARPRKNDAEKAKESITIRLTMADYEAINHIAISRRLPLSAFITSMFAEKGYLDHKISDEEYSELLNRPEMLQVVSQQIPKKNRRLCGFWITKEEKKSLTYHAVVNHKCSLSVLVNKIVLELIGK